MDNRFYYRSLVHHSDSTQDKKRGNKIQRIILLVFATLIFSLPLCANAVKNADFNHFSTGFPLSGQHVKVDCELCHINGVFKGTPTTCIGCHNGRSASGKNSKHIVSTDACDDCHTTFAWDKATVDHSAVKGDCKFCHKLPLGHLATTRQCDDCHGTIAWEPARFDHTNVTAGCISCHTKDKPNDHVPTTADCGFCHGTIHWKPGHFNHVTITDPCSTCHGNDKPIDHIPTIEECGACHSTQGWLPVLQSAASVVGVATVNAASATLPSTSPSSTNVDHNSVAPGACNRCHISDKPAGHISTTRSCDVCHNAHTWSGAKFDHSNSTGQCISCHANDKPLGHLRTRAQCSECHNTNTWNSTSFDHSHVANNCVSCHSNTAARGKPKNHPPTNNVCENCHNTRGWMPVNFDHSSTTAACRACHKKMGRHPKTSNVCSDCHNSTNWSNVRFDHSGVTRSCDSCHNKPRNHLVTKGQCNDCHRTTTWQTVVYNHNSSNYPGNHQNSVICVNCHGRTLDKASWRSPNFAPDCAGCHVNAYRPGPHTKYGNIKYTVGELRDCAGPCHVYTDSSLTQISGQSNGGRHRTNSGGFD